MMPEANPAPVKILYFARLGEQLGCCEESMLLNDGIATARALRDNLMSRKGQWAALAGAGVRMAVNQELVDLDSPVAPGDEVAFLPPVSGG